MFKSLTYAFLLIILLSCSDEELSPESFDIQNFPQFYQLSGMNTGLSGQILTGNDLPYQETILLKASKKFVKTRNTKDTTIIGEGTFEFMVNGESIILTMTYAMETELISSCKKEKIVERLNVDLLGFLTGGSLPCDGPGVYYELAR